jgi:hypothetical protein
MHMVMTRVVARRYHFEALMLTVKMRVESLFSSPPVDPLSPRTRPLQCS